MATLKTFGLAAIGLCASAWGDNEPREVPLALSNDCPAYFAADPDGACRLQSLYDIYPSAHSQWGGYRVALPPRRDGFTPEQIDLGRYLFFDPVLSSDGTLACAHCHHPSFSLADGRGRSVGKDGVGIGPDRHAGTELDRGAPSLWNLAFQETFFWDARADSLEDQITTVITTPEEMNNSPEAVVRSLSAIESYRSLFRQAFGTDTITFDQVQTALVAFETSLVSLNSAYDRYVHGARDALNSQEINGLHVFRSFASRCSQCHTPPLFTSGQVATTGVPTPPDLPFDRGAELPTGEPTLRAAFKVPTLRNIDRGAPYMHAGQSGTLVEAIEFYNARPGHAVPDRTDLKLHWHMVEPNLTDAEIQDLAAFLGTLTDETALPAIPQRLPSGLPVPGAGQVNQPNGDNHATP